MIHLEVPMTGDISRVLGLVLLLGVPGQVVAQGATITACYPKPAKNGTPGSGVVYRINKPAGSAPSAPAACSTG